MSLGTAGVASSVVLCVTGEMTTAASGVGVTVCTSFNLPEVTIITIAKTAG